MKTTSFCFLLFISLISSWRTAVAQDCNCAQRLANTVRLFDENYSGITDKVNVHTETQYKHLLDSLSGQAKGKMEEYDCFKLVKGYVDFFHDHHIGLYYATPDANATVEQVKQFYSTTPRSSLSDSQIINYVSRTRKLDPVEGIWLLGANYRVAILKNKQKKGQYDGIVLNSKNKYWFPGDVKLTLKQLKDRSFETILSSSDHCPYFLHFELSGDKLGDSVTTLYRAAAPGYTTAIVKEEAAKAVSNNSGQVFSFSQLSPYTSVLHISSFDKSFKTQVDSVIAAGWNSMTTLPNLVIDIRNNGGGQDYMFDTLIYLAYNANQGLKK